MVRIDSPHEGFGSIYKNMLSLIAYADGKVTVIAGNGANVRSSASTGGNIVGSALYNETYDVISTVDAGGYTWYEIKLSTGDTGFVRGDLVTAEGVSTTTPATPETPEVTEETSVTETEPATGTVSVEVNVRKGASTKTDRVATANKNTIVNVNGYTKASVQAQSEVSLN